MRTLDFNRESPVSSNSGRFYGSSATMTYVLRGRSRGGVFIYFLVCPFKIMTSQVTVLVV